MIKLIISGYLGKMGTAMREAVANDSNRFSIVAGVDKMYNGGNYDVPVYSSFDDLLEAGAVKDADGIVDFSRPEAVHEILEYCESMIQCGKRVFAIIGTTALTKKEKDYIDKYAPIIPIFSSGNMSLGVNLQLRLAAAAAATLGNAFDVEIVEKHHSRKVDAPSGTALMIADAVNSKLAKKRVCKYGRYTKTEARSKNEIGIHSVRGGTVVGEHEVMFLGNDEVLEITHHAYSKQIFAQGALRAAEFMKDKQPGIYNMQDVVVEKETNSNIYVTTDQSIILVSGLENVGLSDVFNVLEKKHIQVDMISFSSPDVVSFSVRKEQHNITCFALSSAKFANENGLVIREVTDISKITVEGKGMEFQYGVVARVLDALTKAGVVVHILTSLETKISLGIFADDVETAVHAIAEAIDI